MQHQERLHALDAVRAFALLLGIFFHAAQSFVVTTGGLQWAIADSSQSIVLYGLVAVTHVFRMSLFFFVAGFFAHLVYHRKGAEAFARDRLIRIVLPFVVGWCIVSPLESANWHWGAMKSGTPLVGGLWPTAADWSRGEIDLTHLWFLYYLILIYVAVIVPRHLFVDRMDPNGSLRLKIDHGLRGMMTTVWAPVVLSLPVAIAAIFTNDWLGMGMPTPSHSLIPELIPLVGYGAAFLTGWLFHRDVSLLRVLNERRGTWWLPTLAFAVWGTSTWMLHTQPMFFPAFFRFCAALTVTMVMWNMSFGILQLALKKFSHASARTRYIADSSYWLYIAHLPIVVALQVWMADWNLHWTLKYPIIVAIAFAVLFASYHYLVRFTFIGAVLNGRKYSRTDAATLSTSQAIRQVSE